MAKKPMTATKPGVPKCGAKTSAGGSCEREAGWGTDHAGFGKCKMHLGNTPALRKHGAIAAARALMEEQALLGERVSIHPTDALLWMVEASAGFVSWLQLKIEAEGEDALTVMTGGGEEGLPTPRPSVWLQIFNDERTRLAKFSKMALDAGVAERQVTIAEQQGQLLAQVMQLVLDDLALSPAQQKRAPAIVRTRMLEMATIDGREVRT